MLRKKIEKALFEGRLLQVGFKFLRQRLDWLLGCLARYLYALFTKVDPKQIFFISFQGDFTCNPKYIANKLIEENVDCKMVFSARKHSIETPDSFPKGVQLVEQYSADYYKEIAKSKIIIVNSVEFLKKPTWIKRSQILIETWHGSLGIKRFDAAVNSGKAWVSAARRCGRRSDYIISNSTFEDMVYRTSFWPKTPILQYGHPRNDILFDEDPDLREAILTAILPEAEADAAEETAEDTAAGSAEELAEALSKSAGEPKKVHYLLYAPTFRDSHKLSPYLNDFSQLRRALETRFGGEWKVLIRLHPTVRKMAKKYRQNKHAIDVTAYPDIQELMMIADAAITDYSSWIYDFILTKRPGFLYVPDLDHYADERGFYYPLSSTPFPLSMSVEELCQSILEFDEDAYRKKVDAFLADKGCVEDGHASERIVEKLKEILG